MRALAALLLAALLFLYGGCKNDLDLLADYKPVIVCVGLLNPADSVQYIRISRGFAGAGNALVMAQNPDSIGFPEGTLDVRMEQWKNGQLLQTFILRSDTSIPRDSGIFLHPHQTLYRGTFPVLKDGSTYKIHVTDLVKGTSITAETPIVQDVVMVDPANVLTPLNLKDTTLIRFRCKTGAFGKKYLFKVRFHYTEQFVSDTTEVSEHYIDWYLGEQEALSDGGNEVLTFAPRRDAFLRVAGQLIPSNIYVRRIAGKIDFIYLGAAQELVTYMNVQFANSHAATDLPNYTNVQGGYGLLSSRTTTVIPGFSLDSDTRNALRQSPYTQSLNFIR